MRVATFNLENLGSRLGSPEEFSQRLNVLRPQIERLDADILCLQEINAPELNILTIEDPVEYNLDGISQVQVNTKKGLTFATGLRSFLRQDPDVMMVGEVRDNETADIAIRAALTGHLVFSTVHTNDSASTVTRMLDIGVEPYLVSSSILMVIAQRLVRTICPQCRELVTPDDRALFTLEDLGLELDQFAEKTMGSYIDMGAEPIASNWRPPGARRRRRPKPDR